MSTQYNTEPAATASATLNTTFGPIHIALFAKQTPLTCRNFLQHCMDNYYVGTIFHRVVPDFIVQGGDPTGTGSGGTSIYEYPEFEYDPDARDPNEKVVLRDELHSRLRFNRRMLVGMAKSEDGTYGSQFFITLANTERELNGQCTMFGRIEGDSIYNVLKIAEAERIEGSERPMYPAKVTSCEIGELGPLEGKVKKRQITATATKTDAKPAPKKKKKAKGGKTLLSFGGDEGDEDIPIRPAKPKFNPTLVTDVDADMSSDAPQKTPQQPAKTSEPTTRKRPRSPSPVRSPSVERKHRPKSPDPATQIPLPDPESSERSPESPPPAKSSRLDRTNEQIESLKASMRRNVTAPQADTGRKKSALEAMIPETSIRGRKRGHGGSTNGVTTSSTSVAESDALRMFNAFKSRLENADTTTTTTSNSKKHTSTTKSHKKRKEETRTDTAEDAEEDEESQLCDLHFIANCQSCQSWNEQPNADAPGTTAAATDEDDRDWLSHELRFGKDTLGKDLKWKRENPEDADSLVVIDPREREKEFVGSRGRKQGMERDRERDRKRERAGEMEWDQRGRDK